MIFNYDLGKESPSYDFAVFLALCEQERLKAAEDSFYVYINSNISQHYRNSVYDWRWRIPHLLFPLALMMPNCRGVAIGIEGQWLGHYLINLKKELYFNNNFKHLTASKLALDAVPAYDNVITFRERSLEPTRNSNKKAWWSAFNGSNDLFIQDNEAELSLENINVELRMAIYQKAKMNWFVSNGCAALCILNPDINYKVFKIETPSVGCTTIRYINKSSGINRGDSPRIANEGQKYIWQEDTYENIKREKG